MTPLDLKKLRKLALAATPGPWRESVWVGPIEWHDGVKASITAHGPMHLYNEGENPSAMRDAEFIAASSPSVVLELLDRVEALERRLSEYEKQ